MEESSEGVTQVVVKSREGWVPAKLAQQINLTRRPNYTIGYTLCDTTTGLSVWLDGNPASVVGLEFASAGYEFWWLCSRTIWGAPRRSREPEPWATNSFWMVKA